MKWMSMAWEMAATMGVLVFLGWKCDGWWGTKPWFTLAGSILGVVGAMWVMFRKALKK
ncbi:MAG: AtpZ/AtpI family protein [Bacteroidia bacterium]